MKAHFLSRKPKVGQTAPPRTIFKMAVCGDNDYYLIKYMIVGTTCIIGSNLKQCVASAPWSDVVENIIIVIITPKIH